MKDLTKLRVLSDSDLAPRRASFHRALDELLNGWLIIALTLEESTPEAHDNSPPKKGLDELPPNGARLSRPA